MSAAAIALGFLGAIFHPQRDLQIERYNTNGWRVEVKQDRFTGHNHCTAKAPAMTYDRGVVTFYFSSNTDTANALFKPDDGPLRPAGEVAVEAAGLGANFSSQNLQNPSNGEVHIPSSYLMKAKIIAIRPDENASHREFKLTGLSDMISTLRDHGCTEN